MRSLLDAVTFLTRVPLPVDHRRVPDLARAAGWFPVVGAVLGALLLLLGAVVSAWTSVLVGAVLVVVAEVVLTGALHLDGLADLADASGGRDRDTRLRIMKDSATGVFGTAAVVLALLLEVALLTSVLPGPGEGGAWSADVWLLPDVPGWASLGLVGAAPWSLSRAAMLPVAAALPYARAEGTGRGVVDGLTWRTVGLGGAVPLAMCLVLGPVGLAMLAGALAAAGLVGWVAHRLLGGATGDVLGATAQAALLGALLALVVTL